MCRLAGVIKLHDVMPIDRLQHSEVRTYSSQIVFIQFFEPFKLLSRTSACTCRVAGYDRPDPRTGIDVKSWLTSRDA